jgi:hypothetical protein
VSGKPRLLGFPLWSLASGTGVILLWRAEKDMRLPCEKRLPDGSYLSRTYPSQPDQKRGTNGVVLRVIEYCLEGVEGSEPIYRLVTTVLDHAKAPATGLAALYHDRWEIETTFDALKTHLRGSRIILRSKTPDLVRQEFYGLRLAHFAIRGLMHEAALKSGEDPDQLSFLHTVRVVRRKMALLGAIPPQGQTEFHNQVLEEILHEKCVSSRNRHNQRGVKGKLSNYPRGQPVAAVPAFSWVAAGGIPARRRRQRGGKFCGKACGEPGTGQGNCFAWRPLAYITTSSDGRPPAPDEEQNRSRRRANRDGSQNRDHLLHDG